MAIYIKVKYRIIDQMDKEYVNILMEIFIMVNLLKVKENQELINLQIKIFMQDIGKMIKLTEKG